MGFSIGYFNRCTNPLKRIYLGDSETLSLISIFTAWAIKKPPSLYLTVAIVDYVSSLWFSAVNVHRYLLISGLVDRKWLDVITGW